jgi:hypothetical protein
MSYPEFPANTISDRIRANTNQHATELNERTRLQQESKAPARVRADIVNARPTPLRVSRKFWVYVYVHFVNSIAKES